MENNCQKFLCAISSMIRKLAVSMNLWKSFSVFIYSTHDVNAVDFPHFDGELHGECQYQKSVDNAGRKGVRTRGP